MDRQVSFKDLMSEEPKPPKKPTNEINPIYCDTLTLKKEKQEIQSHGRRRILCTITRLVRYAMAHFCRCLSYFLSILHQHIFLVAGYVKPIFVANM